MSGDDINIDVGLDSAAYVAGAQQLIGSNQAMINSLSGLTAANAGVQKIVHMVTPTKALAATFGAAAIAAGDFQSNLAGISATSAITGISTTKLGKSIQTLSMSMPLGQNVASGVVQQLTQLGLSSSGTEPQIAKLAKTMTNLSGATGGDPSALTAGMTELAKATGNQNLDPKRVADLADSLTTVSKVSGASAQGILAFSSNIAPIASAAGIGATGILGISASMASLGQDGAAGGTAINKMLSDMSKSVREGGPEMKTYAEITGTTAANFKKMYENDPTATLNSVIKSITQAGQQGPRMLEQLGLDGVRTMKSLTALASSGGLSADTAAATKAYGSGNTQKAAEAAFSGLNAQFADLTSASQVLAQQFGAPLLGPLTMFVKALKAPVGLLTSVIGSGPGQALMQVAGMGIASFAAIRLLLKPAAAFGLARQAATSGVVTAYQGGLAHARGDVLGESDDHRLTREQRARGETMSMAGRGGRNARYRGTHMTDSGQNSLLTHYADDTKRPLSKQMQTAWDLGAGQGLAQKAAREQQVQANAEQAAARRQAFGDAAASSAGPVGMNRIRARMASDTAFDAYQAQQAAMPKQNVLKRAWGGVSLYGGAAGQTALGEWAKLSRNARIDAGDRIGGLAAPASVHAAWGSAKDTYTRAGAEGSGIFGRLVASGSAYNSTLAQSRGELTSVTAALGKFGVVLKEKTMLTGKLGADAATLGGSRGSVMSSLGGGLKSAGKGLWGAAGSLLGSVGGMSTLALMGAGEAYSKYNELGAANAQAATDARGADVYGTVNAYRESTGRAAVPQLALDAGAKELVKAQAAEVTTPGQATTVNPGDQAAAADGKGALKSYYGTAAQQAAEIRGTQLPGGMTTQDLQGVKMDLLKAPGATAASVNAIMKQLGPQTGVTSTTVSKGGNEAGIASMVGTAQRGIAGTPEGGGAVYGVSQGWAGRMSGGLQTLGQGLHLGNFQPGESNYLDPRSDQQKKDTADVGKSIKARYAEQSTQYSGHYASAERNKAMNAAMVATKDVSQQAQLGRDFASQVDPNFKGVITSEDMSKYGSYTAALAAKDPKGYGAKGGEYDLTRAAEKAAGKGGIKADITAGSAYTELSAVPGGQNKYSAHLYDQRNQGTAAQAMQASAANPANVKLAEAAGHAFVAGGQDGSANDKVKMSLDQLDVAAQSLAGSMTETAAQAAGAAEAMKQISIERATAQQGMSRGAISQSSYTTALSAIGNYNKQADHSNAAATAMNDQNIKTVQGVAQGNVDQMRNYLETHRSYELQVKRAKIASNLAAQYAEIDNQTQITRTVDAGNLQRTNAIYDFGVQQGRTVHDYQLGVHNQIRDYQVGILNAEQDSYRARKLALRDFNIGVARGIEDAAKTMYDPYERIQTKATWDAQNMVVNLNEQTAALSKQKSELNALRKKGLSSQAIAQLSLGDASNGQQVDNLILDSASDPNSIKALNAAAKSKGKAAGALYTDPSNTALTRSAEDLKKSLGDQATSLQISIKRSNKALGVSLNDSAIAFRLGQQRTNTDFNLGLSRAKTAMSLNLGYMEHDQALSLSRTNAANALNLKHMAEDISNADQSIGGNMASLHKAVMQTMARHLGSYTGIMNNDTQDLVNNVATNLSPKMIAAYKAMGFSAADLANPALVAKAAQMKAAQNTDLTSTAVYGGSGKRAEGGRINGFSPHSRADNIPIDATAGEFMQPVDAVSHYGMEAMEKLRAKKISKHALQALAAGGIVDIPAAGFGMDQKRKRVYGIGRDLIEQTINSKIEALAMMRGGGGSSYGGPAGSPAGSAQVMAWILQALKIMGLSPGLANGESRLIMNESSGNPDAINLTDSNAVAGHPSQGLTQTIPTTYAEWVWPALKDRPITDPVANITAGVRYAINRYGEGMVRAGGRTDGNGNYIGYDQGGMLKPGDTGFNHTNVPEPVLTGPQWQSITELTAAVGQLVTQEQSKQMTGAGAAHMSVSHHENITYDHRNDFGNAQITVQSQDPDDMARKLERKQVIKRVTQTRGVRR